MPLLKIENLHFTYNDYPVLCGVNFELHKGDFWAIIGPNGGGKTTLLKLILGLLKPQNGNITQNLHPNQIGYVPQITHHNIDFPIQVFDVIKMGFLRPSIFGFRIHKDEQDIIDKTLEQLHLKHLAHKPLSQLSGGERQKVLIARALVNQPALLILDEPTSNIDPNAQNEIYKLLHRLNSLMSIIVVSHDMTFALKYAQKILYVNQSVTSESQGVLLKNHCEGEILTYFTSKNMGA